MNGNNDGMSNCNTNHENKGNTDDANGTSNNSSDNVTQEEGEVAAMKIAATTNVAATDGDCDGDGDQLGNLREDDSVSKLPVVPAVCVDIDGGISVEIDTNAGRKLVGKKVQTTFGAGVVLDYRSRDSMYVIQIENNTGGISTTTMSTVQVPKLCLQGPMEIANQLNVAYASLEKMRRLNLDVQCYELGIPSSEVDCDMCTACLLANKGSTKSHFPRLQRLLDSGITVTNDLDNQVHEQFPVLHNFFNSTTTSSAASMTESNDAKLQKKFPVIDNCFNPTSSAASMTRSNDDNDANLQHKFPRIHNLFNPPSSAPTSTSTGMAIMVGASLQSLKRVSNDSATTMSALKVPASANSTAMTTAAMANLAASSSTSKDAARDESLLDKNSGEPLEAEKPTTTSNSVAVSGGESNDLVPATTNASRAAVNTVTEQQQSSARVVKEAAAAVSAKPPPSQTNTAASTSNSFPRIRRLWGTIQSLPQPQVPMSTLVARTAVVSVTPAASTASLEVAASSATSSSQSFPRIRNLINSPVTQSIFGETKVKQEGSSADPNILMYNRISGLSNTNSSKPSPMKSDKPIALPRIQRLINRRARVNTSPCLICASPSCPPCSSTSFRREGITLCLKCERLFALDFIVDCVSSSDATKRSERIEYMVDCYDRCILLLQYSKQFGKQIATSLEDQKGKQDKIGLASSSVGVLSGVLGIAAAASILTPAGPPLLIASLFFGGSATTVQSGTEALNYLSQPRKLADRIIALHGMSLSILRVTSTLRDAMLRDHIRTDIYEVEPMALGHQMKEKYDKNKTAVVMGSNFGRSLTLGGLAGVEAGAAGAVVGEISAVAGASASASAAAATGVSTAGAAGARSATALSRAGTAAARTVRFARFAGGALSAAVLVMEANAIQSTIKSMNEGSPCDKANTLRRVIEEIEDFPSTNDLDEECQAYLSALATRPPPPVEVSAVTDDFNPNNEEIPEAACQQVQDDQLCSPGAVILDPIHNSDLSDTDGHPTAAAVPVSATSGSSFLRGSSSFFQSIHSRREDRRAAEDEIVAVAVGDDQLGESNFSLVL